MWLFRRSVRSSADAIDEIDALKEEAAELQLKLEALRMADYREAQRIACGSQAPLEEAEEFQLKVEASRVPECRETVRIACGVHASPAPSPSPSPPRVARAFAQSLPESSPGSMLPAKSRTPGLTERTVPTPCRSRSFPRRSVPPAKRSSLQELPYVGVDLEDMYDFSPERLAPLRCAIRQEDESWESQATEAEDIAVPCTTSLGSDIEVSSIAEVESDELISEAILQRMRLVQEELRHQEEALEAQACKNNERMVAASEELEMTHSQVRELTDLLEAKKCDGPRVNDSQLDMLAVDTCHMHASIGDSTIDLQVRCQQLPEDTRAAAGQEIDEHVLQLVAMTEELTDALEEAQISEDDVRRQLAMAEADLQQERAERLANETELLAARQRQDTEIAELQLRLRSWEESLAWERAHVKVFEGHPQQMGNELDAIKKGEAHAEWNSMHSMKATQCLRT